MMRAYTVVIPAYNAAATLAETIASAFAQTEPPQAVVVVDDGSSDGTAAVAAAIDPRVRVIRKANGGPGSATTAGIHAVATPYFATLDSDDLWLPHKMTVQLDRLDARPDLAAVFALGRLFRDGTAPDESAAPQRMWTRTTMVFRTEAARAVGDLVDFPGYLGELIDWLERGRAAGQRHEMIEEVLALRRVRPGSLSDARNSDRVKGYLHAIHEALKRREAVASAGGGPAG
ncbi:glycosyltransferase family 2 protein [Prosthecomicrobium pneumaticum]|uniref:Glycosyltransferase involved in cell wall biosynthesis n=1 Tax=Prosthecomicrobium pneumaticum TaxID=81895 RepID=A0A7W9FKX5_9HYPH|nr:glycosyltransferase family A protein [Prosthecomicrobium pneumaticum]MBB5751649.1 glycosyltransferase involved in cell wall biosynthesis [Prosthecomicrobium pneumaticum]